LVPVAALVGGALVYQARSPARATGSSAGAERARPASSGDTTGPVAESSAEPAKPEPAPPPTTSPPEPEPAPPPTSSPAEPVTKAQAAAARSPGAAVPAARAQSAEEAGVSTGILDTTHLPARRRIVVDG